MLDSLQLQPPSSLNPEVISPRHSDLTKAAPGIPDPCRRPRKVRLLVFGAYLALAAIHVGACADPALGEASLEIGIGQHQLFHALAPGDDLPLYQSSAQGGPWVVELGLRAHEIGPYADIDVTLILKTDGGVERVAQGSWQNRALVDHAGCREDLSLLMWTGQLGDPVNIRNREVDVSMEIFDDDGQQAYAQVAAILR
jgi:hypothetical protein